MLLAYRHNQFGHSFLVILLLLLLLLNEEIKVA